MARRRVLKDIAREKEVRDAIYRVVNSNTEYGAGVSEKFEYVEAWRSATSDLISKVTSVIAGRTIGTVWTNDIPIAATDGEDILLSGEWFAERIVPNLISRSAADTVMEWAKIKGVSYHEVAHILWSPRANHKPLKSIKDEPDYLRIWNLLEDQRIESFFVAKYKPAIPFFTRMVLDFVINNEDPLAWLWLHGRKYISSELRDKARARFEATHSSSAQFAAIIDEYRTLVFPADGERAVELIEEFAGLFASVASHRQDQFNRLSDRAQNGHENHKKGKTVSLPEEREARDELLDSEAGSEASEPEAPEPEAPEPSSEGGEEASGAEKLIEEFTMTSEINRLAEQLAEQDSDLIYDEGIEMLKTVSRMAGDNDEGAVPKVNDTYGRNAYTVEPWMKASARRLTQEIMRVTSEGQENWDRGNSSGRLNVVDVMQSQGSHFDVFDVWQDIDDQDLSFEVVILFDRSSSMGNYPGSMNQNASKALWVTKRAFEMLEIPTTVLGYDNGATMVMNKETRVSANEYWVLPASGGTSPIFALRMAESILTNSNAKNKLIVSITDGQWWFDDNCTEDQLLKGLALQGVASVFVTIGGHSSWIHRSNGRFNGHMEWVNLHADTLQKLPVELGLKVAKMARQMIEMNRVAA